MREAFQKIWQFSEKRHKAVCTSLLFSFLRSAFGITQILSIIRTVQVLTGQVPVKSGVIQVIALTVICILGNFLTSYFEQTNTMLTGYFMTADKRVNAGNLLRRLPLGFFSSSSVGRITATLTTTLSGVESASVMVMVGIVSGLFNSLALFLFMLFYDWKIAVLAGIGMIAYLLVVGWQMKVSRKNAPALQLAQTGLAEAALTFLQGVKVTKAFSAREGDRKLHDAVEESRRANLALTDVSMPSQFSAGICVAVFESAILLMTLYRFFTGGDLDLIKAVVLLIFSFMVYASLNQAGSMLSMIGLLDSSLDEMEQIEQAGQLTQREPAQESRSNEIEFHDVSFSYGKNEVLHHIDAVMKPNSVTAIVGPSGSGKTTLCQLIPRFRDVSAGSITIGGADVRNLAYEDLMKKVSMVFQNVYLFEDTVLNNIRFGKPDATLEEVQAAARAARCHDFIMALPNGYDTMVEEGGSNLSGGEKQRISIARAMLKDAPIIILDEATSALDAENENEILAAIDELTRHKTVIMIAHRIKTVEHADQILVVDHGSIIQRGTHEALRDQPGLYRDFLQTRTSAAGWRL